MYKKQQTPSARRRRNDARKPPAQIDAFIDQFLATVCEKSRRSILQLLAPPHEEEAGGFVERRSGDIAKLLGLSKATVSEHLQRLMSLHLVLARREGTEIYYRLSNHHLVEAFRNLLQALHTHHQPHDS